MPSYGKGGVKALEEWLQKDGVANIEAVNRALSAATPWAKKVGVAA
jgi:tagatose 1,6-diphosphate aldolase